MKDNYFIIFIESCLSYVFLIYLHYKSLVNQFLPFLKLPWCIKNEWLNGKPINSQIYFYCTHIFREGNQAADLLAKMGLWCQSFVKATKQSYYSMIVGIFLLILFSSKCFYGLDTATLLFALSFPLYYFHFFLINIFLSLT